MLTNLSIHEIVLPNYILFNVMFNKKMNNLRIAEII